MDVVEQQELTQEVNSTGLGHWLYQYRKLALVVSAALLVAASAAAVYYKVSQTKHVEALDQFYQFKVSVVTPFLEGKTESVQWNEELGKLSSRVLSLPNMVPVLIQVSSKLLEKGEIDTAKSVVEKIVAESSDSNKSKIFLTYQLAMIKEDQGDVPGALELLESILKKDDKTLGAKLYLDLGRLYKEKGDKEMAKKNFNHLLETFPSEDVASLAEVYLQELAQ